MGDPSTPSDGIGRPRRPNVVNKVVDEVVLPAAKWWVTEGLFMAVFMHFFGARTGVQKERRLESNRRRSRRLRGKGENWEQKCLEEFEQQLSQVVGLKTLKEELRMWAKGQLMDRRRQAAGAKNGERRLPHLLFLGSPGTGKTTVARLLGRLLHSMGMLQKDTVLEVQRTDLVGQYVGHTGPKTRAVINQARGGILFVDEVYRLMPSSDSSYDFGKEALEEIMSAMESDDLLIIFAGYEKPFQTLLEANEGFQRRVAGTMVFSDMTCMEIAEVMQLHMKEGETGRLLNGFKLHPDCTAEALAQLLEKTVPKELRQKTNGGLANIILSKARDQLDKRLDLTCTDLEELSTITKSDVEAAVKAFGEQASVSTIDKGCPLMYM